MYDPTTTATPSIEQLIERPNVKKCHLVINVLKYLMESGTSTVFTGRQGTGKTTLLNSSSQHIPGPRLIVDEPAEDESVAFLITESVRSATAPMFGHKAQTGAELIRSLSASLLITGVCATLQEAMGTALSIIRVNVHMDKDDRGNRYVSRITELLKDFEDETRDPYCQDLVRYNAEDKTYEAVGTPSADLVSSIAGKLPTEKVSKFLRFLASNFGSKGE